MRDIKFKAKRKDNQEWVYGYYVRLYNTQNKRVTYRVYTGYSEYCGDELFEEFYEVIPETICEYTGLKDKNGVEIYENDVLLRTLYDDEGKEYLKAEYTVIFDTEEPRFIINENWEELRYMNWKRNHKKYKQQLGSFGVKTNELEVIGNIYDKEVEQC